MESFGAEERIYRMNSVEIYCEVTASAKQKRNQKDKTGVKVLQSI